MSIFELYGGNAAGLQPAPYTPTTFREIASAAFGDAMFRNDNSAALVLDNTGIRDRDRLIRERFAKEPMDFTPEIAKKYTNPTPEGRIAMAKEHHAALDNIILEGRKSAPQEWAGIKTTAEIEEFTRSVARQARTEFEDTASRATSGTDAIAGSLAGGLTGSFTDPYNLATMPLGIGSGFGILKTMLFEGGLNAAIEAEQIPSVMKWQKELGYKYGVGEAAADIAMAGGGGAALTGLARSAPVAARILTATGRLAGSRGQRFLGAMADSPALPSAVRDAARYMSRVAHVDEEIPVVNPTREDVSAHRQAMQETQDAFKGYREPELPPRISQVFSDSVGPEPSRFLAKASEIQQTLRNTKQFDVNKPSEVKEVIGYTPITLSAFIRQKGGIADTGGDLAAKGIDHKALPGMIRKTKDVKGQTSLGGMSRQTDAMQIDYMKEAAFDAGYFPSKSSADEISNDEFFEAIEKDLSGSRVYTIDDQEKIARASGGSDLAGDYDNIGVTPDMTVAEIAERLEDFERSQIPFDLDIVPRGTALDGMTRMVEDADSPAVFDALDADFQRLLKDMPEMEILDGQGKMVRLSDISADMKDEDNILNAIRTCAIG